MGQWMYLKIHKSDVTVHNLRKIWKLAPTMLLKGNVANAQTHATFLQFTCVSSRFEYADKSRFPSTASKNERRQRK